MYSQILITRLVNLPLCKEIAKIGKETYYNEACSK